MDAITTVVVIVAVVVVVAGAVVLARTRRRSQLRERFGPEYERTVASGDDRRGAEAELRERVDEREKLDIRPLTDDERETFGNQWHDLQADFVEQPGAAVAGADTLVEQVLGTRGYPVEDFERQADLVSVDHPDVVAHYREAHAVLARSGADEVPTESLRQALVSYRALFAELLDNPTAELTKEREGSR